MSELHGAVKIWLEDPVGKAAVYTGWVTDLKKADVKPHMETIDGYPCAWLTLDEIAEQLDHQHSRRNCGIVPGGTYIRKILEKLHASRL